MVNDKIPEISENEFNQFIKNKTVLIDFFAEWCMPCIMMAPILDELSEEFSNKIKFRKINIESSPKIAQKYNIKSIPHIIILKDGEKITEFTGSLSKEELKGKLKNIE